MATTMSEEEIALNRAIEESLKNEYNRSCGLEAKTPKKELVEKITRSEPSEKEKVPPLNQPPAPPEKPPRSGMNLYTVIKNGWVTKEWR